MSPCHSTGVINMKQNDVNLIFLYQTKASSGKNVIKSDFIRLSQLVTYVICTVKI